MSEFPNLERLARTDPDKLTAKQLQVLVIRSIAENTRGTFSEQAMRTASLGADVPALLAHIDELYRQVAVKDAMHASALEEAGEYRAIVLTVGRLLGTSWLPDGLQHEVIDRVLREVLSERDKARTEATQIAIDTSPVYAELRDERDSARRERDEAMAKVGTLSARRQEELDGLKAKCGQQAAMLAYHCKTRDEVLAVLDRFNTVPADDEIAETLIDSARNLLAGGAR